MATPEYGSIHLCKDYFRLGTCSLEKSKSFSEANENFTASTLKRQHTLHKIERNENSFHFQRNTYEYTQRTGIYSIMNNILIRNLT